MPSKPRIIVSETLDNSAVEWLARRAEVVHIGQQDAGFGDAVATAEGLIVRTYTSVSDELLNQAPALKVVGSAGTGLDNIDQAACEERGIEVVHTPEANRQAVVEYVVSLLLHSVRPQPPQVEGGLSEEAWVAARSDAMAGRQLNERCIGILGL